MSPQDIQKDTSETKKNVSQNYKVSSGKTIVILSQKKKITGFTKQKLFVESQLCKILDFSEKKIMYISIHQLFQLSK